MRDAHARIRVRRNLQLARSDYITRIVWKRAVCARKQGVSKIVARHSSSDESLAAPRHECSASDNFRPDAILESRIAANGTNEEPEGLEIAKGNTARMWASYSSYLGYDCFE